MSTTVADNLNAVADKIDQGKMWCKGQWAAWGALADKAIGDAERVGCAEGLLAEQVGLYDGFADVWQYDGGGHHTILGRIPNFLFDDEEEVSSSCYYITELRQTEEWKVLVKTIEESGVLEEHGMGEVPEESVVITWNDHDSTSEEDAASMFRKAAIEAS